jgi:hypothetical protein
MADDQPDTGSDDDAPHGDPTPTGDKDIDYKARFEQLQKDARRWEERSKSNAKQLAELEPLAKRAKELEDASKSDIERATAEAQQHLVRADKAEGELLRLRVAIRKGLTETQAKRLVGATEDELEADADDLMASFKPKEPEPAPKEDDDEPPAREQRRRPQERLRPGVVPDADTEPEETDPRKLAAMVSRGPFGL